MRIGPDHLGFSHSDFYALNVVVGKRVFVLWNGSGEKAESVVVHGFFYFNFVDQWKK